MSDPIVNTASFRETVEKHRAEGWANLPHDQKVFVCAYVKAGYSIQATLVEHESNGLQEDEIEKYLRDPLVQAAIAEVGDQYVEVSTFTRVGLRARLARAIDIALGEIRAPFPDKSGNVRYVRRVDLSAAATLLKMAESYVDNMSDEKPSTTTPWHKEPPKAD